MSSTTGQGAFGVRLIGAFKLASALLLGAAGFGIFRMLNQDMGEVVERFVSRLHLDPENLIVHGAITRLSNLDRSHLVAIGAGTFLYALLEAAEGIGLLLRRHWASYLTIIATLLLFIPEGYEIAHKVDAVRIVVFLVNLAVLVYLIWKLKQERQGEGLPGRLRRPVQEIHLLDRRSHSFLDFSRIRGAEPPRVPILIVSGLPDRCDLRGAQASGERDTDEMRGKAQRTQNSRNEPELTARSKPRHPA